MADDLIAAGVQQPEMDSASILRALSQGPMAQAAQNPAFQLGSGLAGLGAGLQGQPNPVEAQLVQQQDAYRRNQMAMFGVMQSVQRERDRKTQAEQKLGTDLLQMDSPAARKLGAATVARHLKQQGVQLPPGFEQELSAGTMSLDKRKEAYISIMAGADDDYLERTLGVDKSRIPGLKMEAQSPAVYKMLYGKTPEQEKREFIKSEIDQRRADRQDAEFELRQLKEQRAEAKDERQRKEFDLKYAQTERRLAQQDQMVKLAQLKLDRLLTQGPEAKREQTIKALEYYLGQSRDLAERLDKKGYLPKTSAGPVAGLVTGDPSAAMAKLNQTQFPNDPDWVAWKQMQAALIGFDRIVLNDIGARAFQAFKNQFAFYDNPGTLEAIKKTLDIMDTTLKDSRLNTGKPEMVTIEVMGPNGQMIRARKQFRAGEELPPGAKIIRVE